MRRRLGNIPNPDEWDRIGSFKNKNNEYGVFVNKKDIYKKKDWVGFKVVLLGGVRSVKSNFWFTWSKLQKIYADGRDYKIALDYHEDIIANTTVLIIGYIYAT